MENVFVYRFTRILVIPVQLNIQRFVTSAAGIKCKIKLSL
jgi:hypothetical protein